MSDMIPCPHCGVVNIAERKTCKVCHEDLHGSPSVSLTLLEESARAALLAGEIARQSRVGWLLTSQTATTAQFTRKGSANPLVTILLLLCMILPGVLYALLARPTETLFLQVDDYGRITRTMGRH